MKIEVWSDFICPSCYVGKKRLEMALEEFGNDKYIEVEYKSFQLDPNREQSSTDTLIDTLQQQYQLSMEETKEREEQIAQQAGDIGLIFNVNQLLHADTYDAHRLVKLAEKVGKEHIVVEQLFQTYFIHQANIGDKAVLGTMAKDLHLDEEDVDALLSFNKYARNVQEDQEIAYEIGIQDLPFFIFHDRYAVSGAQPVSVYLNVLQDILAEDEACFQQPHQETGSCCVGDGCEAEESIEGR